MKRAEWLKKTRKMRFEEAYGVWQGGPLTQENAARLAFQSSVLVAFCLRTLLICVLFVSHQGFYESTRTM